MRGAALPTFALALAASVLSSTKPARAQVPIGVVTEDAETGARRYFDRSLELYRGGLYREALAQLKRAAELDPAGKDLFFNLALVHEKLGELPEAVVALERFCELESDPKERERARLTIERLRGAEQAGQALSRSPAPCSSPPQPPLPAPRAAPAPDAVLVGAASIAAVSLIVGTVFGLKALADDVSDEATSAERSVEQLRARARRAEREALAADVAFALGLASTATFVSIWLMSPSAPASARGGGVILRGYF